MILQKQLVDLQDGAALAERARIEPAHRVQTVKKKKKKKEGDRGEKGKEGRGKKEKEKGIYLSSRWGNPTAF